MKKSFGKRFVSFILSLAILFSYSMPSLTNVFAQASGILPSGFTNVAIGNNDNTGSASFDENSRVLSIKGSGSSIGKDVDIRDSYQFVSYNVSGDATIIARLADFDMSNATYGQAGVFIRQDNLTDNADYIGVYVEPSKNQYRYAFRDNNQNKTGAQQLAGLTGSSKEKYIKIEKVGTSCKIYIAEDKDFKNIISSKGQILTTQSNTWNLGFVVSNGGSSTPATADFDDIIIENSNGIIYQSAQQIVEETPQEPELPDYNQGTLPAGFNNSSIGNNSENVFANYDVDNKLFTINGSGNYIGKDVGSKDDYQFINYKVDGNMTVVARLVNFDMSKAQKGQAGLFVRGDNTTNNADYFGVYVEPSKNQYRYAYRDNSSNKIGAAAINNLTADYKNLYIKIEKNQTTFKYYISEDATFPSDKTYTNTQIVNSNNNTWYVGFVVSNGGSQEAAVATFDNVKIENENKVYYDSTVEKKPVDTVENLKATAEDSKVTLNWDTVNDATSYIVKRAISKDGEFTQVAEVKSPETAYIDEDVVNFDTYYYKVIAKNEKGESNDSKVAIATPNNSNSSNIQYEEDAAVFNMIKEPKNTVFNSVITLEGSTNKDGYISIIQNNEVKVKGLEKLSNETFKQSLTLDPGRNTIEIYQTTEDGKSSIKTYNIVYLADKNYDIVVDSKYDGEDNALVDGKRIFKTIQGAINSVGTKNTKRAIIYVKNGTYKEKVIIESPYVSLIGEDNKNTILTYDSANGTINPHTGEKYGTSKSASVMIKRKAIGFTAENITFENAFQEKGYENEQAVALNNQADQSIFVNCRFIGNQDTLLADADKSYPARQYYYKCYIEGDVDFIFGRAQAVFNDCEIASVNRKSTTNNGYITAADTWDRDNYGYLIMNSRLIGLDNIADNTVSLGRPWRPSSSIAKVTPAVTYVNCYMGSHITLKGWDDMGENSLASTSRFYEYGSYGPGAKNSETRPTLSNNEIYSYTIEKVFAANSAITESNNSAYVSDWSPTNNSSNVNINTWYANSIKVEKIELNASELSVNEGDSIQLLATVGPENVTNKTVIFESSNEDVAVVDKNGNIKAIKPGKVTIAARSGNKQATCMITVTLKQVIMNAIPDISAEDRVLKVGDEFDQLLNVKARDKEDGDLTDKVKVIENTVDINTSGEYKVVYKVTDSQGASVTKSIKVTVNPKFTLINRLPKIIAKDLVIIVGEDFDPLEGIKAFDYEDGDISNKVKVIENTVDISKSGNYKILYKVSDANGASSTKERKVVVEDKEVTKPEVKPEVPETPQLPGDNNGNSNEDIETPSDDIDDSKNESDHATPDTGDAGLLTSLAIFIVATIAFILIRKRR